MKKILILSFLLLFSTITIFAKGSEPVYVYGVDYTSVKVFGADETINQFANAFEGINNLFIKESQKYDFSDVVGENNKLKLEMILDLTKEFDFSDIKTLDKEIEHINLSEKIKDYNLKETEGTGLIIIASLLDKSENKGTYKVVLFDIATREILKEGEFVGKAKGFGLRNYWARSIYNLTKKFEFDSKKK